MPILRTTRGEDDHGHTNLTDATGNWGQERLVYGNINDLEHFKLLHSVLMLSTIWLKKPILRITEKNHNTRGYVEFKNYPNASGYRSKTWVLIS